MSFSFTAAKGFFGTTIRGVLRVETRSVIMDAELPALVRSVVGEDRIRDTSRESWGACWAAAAHERHAPRAVEPRHRQGADHDPECPVNRWLDVEGSPSPLGAT